MAKKSMIAKARRPQKYAVQAQPLPSLWTAARLCPPLRPLPHLST